MKKEQRKRVWTPEQKAEIVYKHLDEYIAEGASFQVQNCCFFEF